MLHMGPDRIVQALRDGLTGAPDVGEIRMFGGTCFMFNGNMLAGTFRNGLLVRVGKQAQADALLQPGTSVMEMRGRPMEGFVFVAPEVLDDAAMTEWLNRARSFVESLPAKSDIDTKERKKK
jgi:TfoX/Sxy family transcriptional regulator of competence genes